MDDLLLFLIILFIFFSIMIFFNKDMFDKDVIRVKSTIDDQVYLVRELPNSKEAANLLASYKKDIIKLSQKLKDKYIDNADKNSSDYEYRKNGVERLLTKFNPNNLSESDPYHKYKSYMINKGEELYLCLRHTKEKNYEFNDKNLVIFTICHELSHVCNITLQHPPEFWDWMKVLLETAEEIGLYQPIDYATYPTEYCGMIINSTPYIFK
jgi:hypothetical protein